LWTLTPDIPSYEGPPTDVSMSRPERKRAPSRRNSGWCLVPLDQGQGAPPCRLRASKHDCLRRKPPVAITSLQNRTKGGGEPVAPSALRVFRRLLPPNRAAAPFREPRKSPELSPHEKGRDCAIYLNRRRGMLRVLKVGPLIVLEEERKHAKWMATNLPVKFCNRESSEPSREATEVRFIDWWGGGPAAGPMKGSESSHFVAPNRCGGQLIDLFYIFYAGDSFVMLVWLIP